MALHVQWVARRVPLRGVLALASASLCGSHPGHAEKFVVIDLSFPGAQFAQAYSVNNSHEVAGHSGGLPNGSIEGFIYRDGAVQLPDAPGGTSGNIVTDINELGESVGGSRNAFSLWGSTRRLLGSILEPLDSSVPLVLDFEEPKAGGPFFESRSALVYGDVRLQAPGSIFVVREPSACGGGCSANGSHTIAMLAHDGPLQLTASGCLFRILSLDLAEGIISSSLHKRAKVVRLTGITATGEALTLSLPLQGPPDGEGNAPDFESFDLSSLEDASFFNTFMTSVEIEGVDHQWRPSSFALDNLSVVSTRACRSMARAVNDQGKAVGSADDREGLSRAFLYEDSEMQDLGTLPGGSWSIANDINEQGEIVGYSHTGSEGSGDEQKWRAFFRKPDGPMVDLGTFGGSYSVAHALNNHGQIVGSATLPGDPTGAEGRAFLLEAGTMHDLGALGGDASAALDINDHGQVVGTTRHPDEESGGYQYRAFVYEDGIMRDLNERLSPESGWTLTSANGINDAGAIVGTGINAEGLQHGFLLQKAQVHVRQIDQEFRVKSQAQGTGPGGLVVDLDEQGPLVRPVPGGARLAAAAKAGGETSTVMLSNVCTLEDDGIRMIGSGAGSFSNAQPNAEGSILSEYSINLDVTIPENMVGVVYLTIDDFTLSDGTNVLLSSTIGCCEPLFDDLPSKDWPVTLERRFQPGSYKLAVHVDSTTFPGAASFDYQYNMKLAMTEFLPSPGATADKPIPHDRVVIEADPGGGPQSTEAYHFAGPVQSRLSYKLPTSAGYEFSGDGITRFRGILALPDQRNTSFAVVVNGAIVGRIGGGEGFDFTSLYSDGVKSFKVAADPFVEWTTSSDLSIMLDFLDSSDAQGFQVAPIKPPTVEIGRSAEGRIQLDFSGRLERSPDLIHWTDLPEATSPLILEGQQSEFFRTKTDWSDSN